MSCWGEGKESTPACELSSKWHTALPLSPLKQKICLLQMLNFSLQSTSSLESNLEGLAGVLEADLPNYKNKILRILCAV